MYDFSSQPPFTWHSRICEVVPQSVREAVAHLTEEFTAAYLLDCLILEKGLRNRLRPYTPQTRNYLLTSEERMKRFSCLLSLWVDGYHNVIDEQLFQDTAQRRPRELLALKQYFRRTALRS